MDNTSSLLQAMAIERSPTVEVKAQWKLPLIVAVFLVSLLVLAYISMEKENSSEKLADKIQRLDVPSAAPVEPVFDISNSNGSTVLEASGYIVARRNATVSAKNFGLITSTQVEEGGFIKQGDVIATLDDSQAKIDLELLQSQSRSLKLAIKTNELELAQANSDLERELKLSSQGFSSGAIKSKMLTRSKSLQNQIDVEKLQYETSLLQIRKQQALLDDFVIRAPFSGIVTEKNAQLGEIISPSTAGGGFTRTGLCTIVDMSSLEIVVDVNESFIKRIEKNQDVIGELYAYPGWEFSGKVARIIPSADKAKATIRVHITIVNADEKILPRWA